MLFCTRGRLLSPVTVLTKSVIVSPLSKAADEEEDVEERLDCVVGDMTGDGEGVVELSLESEPNTNEADAGR